MGSNLGSHAGISPLADYLGDEAERPGHCVTLSVGNEGNERLHFAGHISGDEVQSVEIKVGRARMDLYVNCGQWLRKYIPWK